MSSGTLRAIQDAIEAHIADIDEHGGIVTAAIAVFETTTYIDGDQVYAIDYCHVTGTMSSAIGLAQVAARQLESDMLNEGEDE